MQRFRKIWWAPVLVALVAGCGGGEPGDQSPKVKYSKVVSFGDSLSDVGSYKVSGVAAAGGGKYTVNGGTDDRIWIERLNDQLGLTKMCAAQTGLNAIEAVVKFPPAAVTSHGGCFGYAQGGARVTNPVGPGNALLFNAANPATYSNAIGQLTDPVVNQINRHLGVAGGAFSADDLVVVMAGGNDVFMNLASISATAAAGGDVAAATAAAITAMGAAATDLSTHVKNLILAKGAQRVVVVNLPDVSKTPFGRALDATTQGIVLTMATTFNSQLASGLSGDARVLVVDAFTVDQDQAANPAIYGLTDVTSQACDPAKVGSSLLCTTASRSANAAATWKFADSVHPTPYGYQLLTEYVATQMIKKGWL